VLGPTWEVAVGRRLMGIGSLLGLWLLGGIALQAEETACARTLN
jgi:hypothetical protein